MANPFLNSDCKDVETAILLEQAYQHDIGKAVAFTDGHRVFINTDDNLHDILPDYNNGMLKWLLWHERYHNELRHHNRYFRYLSELDKETLERETMLTKEEVNIIMDILVHDSLQKLFPELVETAINNLSQLRTRNSLQYTFKANTLEDMLEEYRTHKNEDKDGKGEGEGEGTEEEKEDKDTSKATGSKDEHKEESGDEKRPTREKDEPKPEDAPPEEKDDTAPPTPDKGEHDKTDWSKLEDRDSKEFIEEREGDGYMEQINRLKRKKLKYAKLTQTLNGLATTTKQRSYAMPSTIHVGKGVLLKGRTPGKTSLYLCFDASGSMSGEMDMFKEIISKSIPQAMDCPCVWFSGGHEYGRDRLTPFRDSTGRNSDYYKAKFKDFMQVYATNGYSDDGDRVIELCYKAEQMGYSPIGVTDGGGQFSWSKDMAKQLKRTVLVGDNKHWLEAVQRINPKVQIIDVD